VALHVVLQVMAGHKSFATGRIGAGKWPLIGVRSRVLLQIALCCEETRTTRLAAVECVSCVDSLVCCQPVEGGEGCVAVGEALAHKRLLLRVDPCVNAKRIGREKGFSAVVRLTSEPELSSVNPLVGSQVSRCAVLSRAPRPNTRVVTRLGVWCIVSSLC